jgi:glucan phosphoethanolaminetransferase (alkaline phosphatase superfamily)
MKNKLPLRLNYIYFGIVFLLLASLHSWSVLVAAKFTHQFPLVFLLHAVVQAGLEALILAYVAAFLHARRSRVLEGVFISFTVILCIMHIIDFHLVRLMDLSIWYAMDFVLDESWRNFLELLIASSLPFSLIFIGLVLLSLLLILAFWFFTKTQAIVTKKMKWEDAKSKSGKVLLASMAVLCVLDYVTLQPLSLKDYDRLAKALPWKGGFFFSAKEQKVLCTLKSMPELEGNDSFQQPISTPNIFLFVVETLREDYLTEETAPNLCQFRSDVRPITYSSANATQDSWYSIFYSQAPLHFGQFHRSEWKEGSPILSKFKKAGYRLHLYSGSRLSYYGMNDLIFGENYSLIDDINLDFPSRDRQPWQCDQAMVKRLCEDLQKTKDEDGHLFIVFLESPHFTYSWPEKESSFGPYAGQINFLKAACFPKDLEQIKNRYRNSIHYIDQLFGQFLETLKSNDLYDNAVIAITADHGEEYFENGNLFHASTLSEEQIRVPIYFHIGGIQPKVDRFSHVDIMPTFMHLVFGEESCLGLYGKSIIGETSERTTVTGRYNGSRSPHEFIMRNATSRLHARFSNPASPERSKSIIVLSYEGKGEPSVETFENEFGASFTALFKIDSDPRK